MNLLKFQYIFALTVLFQTVSFGQTWTSHESEQQVNDLVETSTELFMATDAGLVVMNKATLAKSIFNTSNSSLPLNHIESITQAANGDIWIGTYDVSLAKFNGSDFVDITIPVHPELNQNSNLFDLEIAANGDFWLGTSEGALQRQGTTWIMYDEDDLDPSFFEIWDIEIDASGAVYAGGQGGLFQFSGGVWTDLFTGTTLEGYLDSELFIASDGIIYFAGDLTRLASYDGTNWNEYVMGFTVNNFRSGMFTEDTNGNIFFNTNYNGIYKLNGTAWVQETNAQITANGDRSDYYYIDTDGNKWLGRNIYLSVDKSGVLSNTLISNTTLETSRTENVQVGDNDNKYFITSSEENISVLDSDGNWSFLAKPQIAGTTIYFYDDILVVADDNIWVSTFYGLHNYLNGSWVNYSLDACKSILKDSQGKVFVRSSNKIYTIENNSIDSITLSNSGITNLDILGHGLDADDNLWIAAGGFTNDNLIQKRNSDGTWKTYTEIDHPVLVRPFGDFTFDKEGNVWVADDFVGAIKFDGTMFTNPITDNSSSITNTNVKDIEIDVEGNLYFAHQYGVTKLKDGVWENLIITDVPQISGSNNSNIALDDEGTLWWGNSRYGVQSYKQTLVDPNVSITENIEALNSFSVFPNPATDFAQVSFEIETTANVNANLYNNMGQVVSSFNLGNVSSGKHQQALNVNGLAKGIYMLQLQVNDKTTMKTIIVR